MDWFDDDSEEAQAHKQVLNAPHNADISHQLIGTAALYEAAKAYASYCAEHGNPNTLDKAKEILAVMLGASVDRIIETKFPDADRERAKHEARKQGFQALALYY